MWISTAMIVVLSRSKIKISKAIHNHTQGQCIACHVVLSRSKIKISKAIHNTVTLADYAVELFSVGQR